MRKMKTNIPLPILGIDTGQPGEFIDSRATPDCQNVEIDRFTIEKRTGTTALGTSLGERVLSFCELKALSSTYFLRIGLTKVELLNKVDSTWSDVTGSALTATAADKVDFTFPLLSGSKILVFTNGVDNIRKYTGTGNTANLGGSPPKAKFCLAFGDYLILANIITGGFPFRVQWSDTGNPENWSTGNSGSQDLVDDPDEASGLALFGSYFSIHKGGSIYLGYPVSTSEIFRFDRKATGASTVSQQTIQNLPNGEQAFLAKDGIRLFNGVSAPLIPSSVNEDIREFLTPGYAYKSWGVVLAEKNEYWVAMPMGNATEPNVIYKYNYFTRQCHKDTRTNISACGLYENITALTWNQKTNSWNSDTTRWNSVEIGSLNPVVVFGDTSGVTTKRTAIFNDNGTAISTYWCSKDLTSQDYGDSYFGRLMDWTCLRLWAKGDSVTVEYSTDSGLNWTTIDSYDLTADYPSDYSPLFVYFDVVSSQIRFRFSNAVAGESFTLKKFYIDATLREMPK